MLKMVIGFCLTFSLLLFTGCQQLATIPNNEPPLTSIIKLNKFNSLLSGQKFPLTTDGKIDGEIDITSNNPEIVSYDPNSGMLIAGNAGRAVITVSKNKTPENNSMSTDLEIEVVESRNIPIISISTAFKRPITSKEDYLRANVTIQDLNNPEYNIEKTGFKDEIRGRGNTTWAKPKKPYRIKFDKKTSLFGLKAAKDWVLLANHQDPTLLLNTIAFELGKRFEMRFSHNYFHVDVLLNGEYIGNYLLTEHNQVAPGRVEIDENKGFFIEFDNYFDEEPKFTSEHYKLPILISSPECSINETGYSDKYLFVREKINTLETLLYNKGEPIPDNSYKNHVDLQSFIDFLLIHEILKNHELKHPKSTFMYMDADGILHMGPLWDFDWAFGFGDGEYRYFTNPYDLCDKHPFFERFYSDPGFIVLYKNRWNIMKGEVMAMENFMDDMKKQIDSSHKANTTIWDLNINFDEEIEKMKLWWRTRISYLDEVINDL